MGQQQNDGTAVLTKPVNFNQQPPTNASRSNVGKPPCLGGRTHLRVCAWCRQTKKVRERVGGQHLRMAAAGNPGASHMLTSHGVKTYSLKTDESVFNKVQHWPKGSVQHI